MNPKELIGMDLESFIDSCKIRATRHDDTSYKRIKTLVNSATEKTTDQLLMTNGRIVDRTFCTLKIRGAIAGHFIIYRDVTNYVEDFKMLHQKNKINEQLTKRSLVHLSTRSKDQPKEIITTLGDIGKAISATRAIIGELDLKTGTFNVLYGCTMDETETSVNHDQSIPLSFVDWFKYQMLDKDYWIIETIEDLPLSATIERSIFTEANAHSAVALTFKSSNPNKKYFVQFSNPNEKFWHRSVIEMLLPLRTLLGTIIKNLELIASRTVE